MNNFILMLSQSAIIRCIRVDPRPLFFLLLLAKPLLAHEADVLVVSVANQLTIGAIDDETLSTELGHRVFLGELPALYTIDEPGFNALAAGSSFLPPGASALLGNAALQWDFLPMTVGAVRTNLLHWNGAGEVNFASAPAGHGLSLFVENGDSATAAGESNIVAGLTIASTSSTGSMHAHRLFFLDDGDANGSTNPADGVYLLAMQVRMAGLTTSEPFFIAFGTPDFDPAVLEGIVEPWIEAREDLLVRDTPPGDFTGDGRVDAADYTAWRDTFGSTTALAADANLSFAIDAADIEAWRANFGAGGAAVAAAASVPESMSLVLLLVALLPRLTSGAHDVLRCKT